MVDDFEAIRETGAAAAVELAASALAAKGANTGTCLNCGRPLIGPYCAVCGQPTHTGRRTVRALLHDFFSDLVSFDSRILRTGRALLFQPGELAVAFRKGRSQPYVPPIRLYFFVTLIFFVLLALTDIALLQFHVVAMPTKVIWDAKGHPFIANPAYDAVVANDPDVKNIIKPLIPITREKANRPGGVYEYSMDVHFFAPVGAYRSDLNKAARDQLLEGSTISISTSDKATTEWLKRNIYAGINRVAADSTALNGALTTWLPRALFLLLPIYALVLALFHIRRRKDFYFVDHLVFSLSIHTFAFFVLIAAVGLAQFVPGTTVALLIFGLISVYIFLAMKRFYEQGWVMTTLKFVIVSAIYTLLFLLPTMAGTLFLSLFGGRVV